MGEQIMKGVLLMKRIIALALALLLAATLPAQAETFFPCGNTLHRDPICVHNDFSLDSCFASTLHLDKAGVIAGEYFLCGYCSPTLPDDAADTDDVPVTWYHNPDGGTKLHRDPDCVTVSTKYKPLAVAQQLPADVLPDNACNICGHLTSQIDHLLDNIVWNSTPEEQAELLPGVWTVPSANAISAEKATAIAKEKARAYSDSLIHSAIPLHYDRDAFGNPRETWQVVVTTSLLHPVCIVYIDALTGEYLGVQVSREYNDQALLDNPDMLDLAVSGEAQVEILDNRVNFRTEPKGEVITRLDKGDTLTLLGEKRHGMHLWYCVSSPDHGTGYVDAHFAQIIHNGQRRGDSGALTDNLLAYCTELRRWQIENGFLTKNENGEFVFVINKLLDTEKAKEEVVALMLKHGITATVSGTAPFILFTHYGTTSLWDIFTTEQLMPGLNVTDWHSCENPFSTDRQRLYIAFAAVDSEYK